MSVKNIFNALFSRKEATIAFSDHVEYRKGSSLRKVWNDGRQEWFKNGQRHRADGPAIIRSCGCEAWFYKGDLCKTRPKDGEFKVYKQAPFKV
jgi:hypothetical protein